MSTPESGCTLTLNRQYGQSGHLSVTLSLPLSDVASGTLSGTNSENERNVRRLPARRWEARLAVSSGANVLVQESSAAISAVVARDSSSRPTHERPDPLIANDSERAI